MQLESIDGWDMGDCRITRKSSFFYKKNSIICKKKKSIKKANIIAKRFIHNFKIIQIINVRINNQYVYKMLLKDFIEYYEHTGFHKKNEIPYVYKLSSMFLYHIF